MVELLTRRLSRIKVLWVSVTTCTHVTVVRTVDSMCASWIPQEVHRG